jgi:hypothetical protein
MALRTRENPETGKIEVLVDDQWVRFDKYRERQIDQAYQNSIRFLRERLGEDAVNEENHKDKEKYKD